MIGAIEAGGTKVVCAVSDDRLNILERIRIKTDEPAVVLPQIVTFFDQYTLRGIGVGAFGPIGINESEPDYGLIGNTPKVGWKNFDFLGALKAALNCPIYWTTDVNAAAYGELILGAARGLQEAVYLTVGTGIGGGIIHQGRPYIGVSHPELGHFMVHPSKMDRDFVSVCPYHTNCLEGFASGVAIERRAGEKGSSLPKDDPLWANEAYYLAQAALAYTLILSPERIIFGGGVSNQNQLFGLIQSEFEMQLNGYVKTPPLNSYLVHAELGDDAGVMGGLLLGQIASAENASD